MTLPLLVFLAGLIHLVITPDHLSHSLVHGAFFALVGASQVVWAVVAYRSKSGPSRSPLLFFSGAMLTAGVIVVWLFAHLAWTPFSEEIHPIDWASIATKAAELLAFGLLLWRAQPMMIPQRLRRLVPSPALAGLSVGALVGFVVWGAGMLAEPHFPDWWHSHDHHHHDGHAHDHDHGAPTMMTISSSVYLTIVNANREVDALVRASSPQAAEVMLHQTVIDERDMARMRELNAVELRPHTRVSFSPASNHIMLERLQSDLFPGDVIELTLEFASGRVITLNVPVLEDEPEGRLNFFNEGGFQISNAWARATRSLDGRVAVQMGDYEWRLPPGFPLPRVPEGNPMTADKVELGRHLFYDTRLSGNNTISCASCHVQALAFSDGRVVGVGATGEPHVRNSQTLTNVAYNATLTWANPNLLTLEQQIVIPMFGEHPIEMGITGNEDAVMSRFRSDPQYQAMFAAAYPDQADPFTWRNIVDALASFNRTLISGDAPFDRYLRGDQNAMSEAAVRGMELFFSERLECHHCHSGFNMSISTVSANSSFDERMFFNTGLYNLDGQGAYPSENTGVHEITNNPSDMGRFRPPTLRNIELTAPYMHDGSIATLEEVIQFYADGGRLITEGPNAGDGRANPLKSGLIAGFDITPEETADLVAFLQALTDETFITDPRFSDPFAAPPSAP
ncbi:MAG: MbnH family di-heme enzyme [Anaerolineae bacterium]